MIKPKEWKIVAWPDPSIAYLNGGGADLTATHDLMRNSCANGLGKMAGWDYIDDYRSLEELVRRVKDKTKAISDTLKEFEIYDHGCPTTFDGLRGYGDVIYYAKRFKKFKWNDNSRFYLTGCNTGNNDPNYIYYPPTGGRTTFCMMTALCNEMLYNVSVPASDKRWFPFHITFFGLKGYGEEGCSHMLDQSGDATMDVSKSFTDNDGHDYTEYPGCEDGKGAQAWRIIINY